VVSSPGSARSSGVAILYKPSFLLDKLHRDDVGRQVIAHFSPTACDSSPFQVVNVYGPNQKQLGEDFFASILPQIDPILYTIFCGDFNTVVDSQLDRMGCNSSSYWAYNWPQTLSHLTSTLNMVDAWRECHPNVRDFTWHRPNGSQASRLDMFWISSSLLLKFINNS
jgi:exonuclease III